ncbi:MAG: CinA family protein, partial [Paludibacteraceae bacterium]|nr:CinA family protein [Paludibacteraceae bacterium]
YLDKYGAVSEQVVALMAYGAKQVLNTDYAVATSGVAGPSGGTPEKPVGTVWIAVATPDAVYTECLHLGKLREQITDRACTKVLVKLLKELKVKS